MTYLILAAALAAASSATPQSPCALSTPTAQRAFTNADLERMSACRYQTGVQSEAGVHDRKEPAQPPAGIATRPKKGESPRIAAVSPTRDDSTEADWRAQWRSVDHKVRKLRREALDLRREALEKPVEIKKRQPATGRRSSAWLMHKAETLEEEARDLEDDFQSRARREGALPGWLRAR
jgi:hypothetical protein